MSLLTYTPHNRTVANCMIWCAIENYVACTVQEQRLWCTRMASHWVQMAAEDAGILAAILSASRLNSTVITLAASRENDQVVRIP